MPTAIHPAMGTVISVFAPEGTDPDTFRDATAAAFASITRIEEIYSTFRPDSPVSRIRDGRMNLEDLHNAEDLSPREVEEMREVLALCARLRRESHGAFDAWAVGDPPAFDPSGAVKGWAAERASALLAAHALPRHTLSAGGDIRLRSGADTTAEPDPASAQPWRIGITDPHRPGLILTVLERADGAVATSGTSERGAHVWDPRRRRPADTLAQVTVTGDDLALADGYATAALALGPDAPGFLRGLDAAGYAALTVDPHGAVWWTTGMSRYAPALPCAAPSTRKDDTCGS
jgi:FAD:protein FMN transferase